MPDAENINYAIVNTMSNIRDEMLLSEMKCTCSFLNGHLNSVFWKKEYMD